MSRYLHALHNAVKKISFFWFELVIVSIVLHSFILFFLFIVYNPITSLEKINLRDCKIQFLALQQQKKEQTIVALNESSSPKNVQINKTTVKPSTTLKNQEIKKVATKKVVQPQKVTAQPKTKPPATKPVQKPDIHKKTEPVKKQPIQTSPEKKVSQPEKHTNVVAEQIIQKMEQKEVTKPIIPNQTEEISIDTNTLLIMEYVINEVQKWWSPIPGLPEDIEVELDFCIGENGIISDVNIIKSSGVLVFDIQARNLFSQSDHQWPRWAWGKTFELSLPNKSEI